MINEFIKLNNHMVRKSSIIDVAIFVETKEPLYRVVVFYQVGSSCMSETILETNIKENAEFNMQKFLALIGAEEVCVK